MLFPWISQLSESSDRRTIGRFVVVWQILPVPVRTLTHSPTYQAFSLSAM